MWGSLGSSGSECNFSLRACFRAKRTRRRVHIGVVRAMGLFSGISLERRGRLFNGLMFVCCCSCVLRMQNSLANENVLLVCKHFPRNEKKSIIFTLFASNSCDVTKGSNTFPKLDLTMTTWVHSAFLQNGRKVQQGAVFFRRKPKPCCKQGAK